MRDLQGDVIYDELSINEVALVEPVYSVAHLWALPPRLDSWRYRYIKRIFDITGALLMSALFLLPCLLIALAILITSPYPVFYSEVRIGRKGVPFRIWKFRSMRPHGASHRVNGPHPVLQWRMDKCGHDPRITPIGGFLRRWSLDEVPQLLNVLRGEMSLIGPRPVVEAETHFYKHLLPYYLAATPGLSGLWQVSGRSDVGYADRARMDAEYVQNWSLGSDFKILIRTIPTVLGRVGAR